VKSKSQEIELGSSRLPEGMDLWDRMASQPHASDKKAKSFLRGSSHPLSAHGDGRQETGSCVDVEVCINKLTAEETKNKSDWRLEVRRRSGQVRSCLC
jgi:hypothetical protein